MRLTKHIFKIRFRKPVPILGTGGRLTQARLPIIEALNESIGNSLLEVEILAEPRGNPSHSLVNTSPRGLGSFENYEVGSLPKVVQSKAALFLDATKQRDCVLSGSPTLF